MFKSNKHLILLSVLGIFNAESMANTFVPEAGSNGATFPFEIEAKGVVADHDGYGIYYTNLDKVKAQKKVILYLSGHSFEDPINKILYQANVKQEKWDDSYSTIAKAQVAERTFNAHNAALPAPEMQDIPVFVFIPRDTELDIRENGVNLGDALTQINAMVESTGIADENQDGYPDYKLIIVANGISGLWVRSMFVLENSNMGVDQLITLDTPHKGLRISLIGELYYNQISMYSISEKQIDPREPESFAFFSWLEGLETEAFISSHIDPIETTSIAYSDGERSWTQWLHEEIYHSPFNKVSSNLSLEDVDNVLLGFKDPITTAFDNIFGEEHGITVRIHPSYLEYDIAMVPYHSAIMVDMPFATWKEEEAQGWVTSIPAQLFENEYTYRTTNSRYFDNKMSLVTYDTSGNTLQQNIFDYTFTQDVLNSKHSLLWSIFSL